MPIHHTISFTLASPTFALTGKKNFVLGYAANSFMRKPIKANPAEELFSQTELAFTHQVLPFAHPKESFTNAELPFAHPKAPFIYAKLPFIHPEASARVNGCSGSITGRTQPPNYLDKSTSSSSLTIKSK